MDAWSIRTYLLLLVFAVATPLGALVGYEIYRDMQQSVAHAKSSLRTLAYTMVSNTDDKISSARKTLEHLANRPQIMQLDATQCDPILQEMQQLNLGYVNTGYINMQGELLCSGLPKTTANQRVQFGNTAWFKSLMQTQRFTVGHPAVGPVSGKWVSILSYPIRNAEQQMVGAVLLGLDLRAFDPHIAAQFLPEGSRYGYFAEDGTMIWRNTDPEGAIGTRP